MWRPRSSPDIRRSSKPNSNRLFSFEKYTAEVAIAAFAVYFFHRLTKGRTDMRIILWLTLFLAAFCAGGAVSGERLPVFEKPDRSSDIIGSIEAARIPASVQPVPVVR